MLSLRLEIYTNVLISDAISLLPAAHRSAACHYQTGPLYVSRPLLEGYSEVLSRRQLPRTSNPATTIYICGW
jgi:hypothetical protein